MAFRRSCALLAPRWLYRGVKAETRARTESTVSNVSEIVKEILQDVRHGGGASLDKYCMKFDRVPHQQLQERDIEQCLGQCTKTQLEAW